MPQIPPMQSLQANGYVIHFNDNGYEALSEVLSDGRFSRIFILADSNTAAYCLPHFLGRLATETPIEIIEIEAGEKMKTIESCVQLWQTLNELGADRKSLLINLGGGVVTDMGGFVAATYKRGISFLHVPTTLLGMVDAAVGGKNGVDLGPLKNQIGVIVPPLMLLIDTAFLETLPPRQLRSGLAEMLKHGLIADPLYWKDLLGLADRDASELDRLIHRSIEIKNQIVMIDPTENGIRKALNFGHTLGHAIESFFLHEESRPELLHGEAVAAGMILEASVSRQLNLISQDEYQEISSMIHGMYQRVEFEPTDIEKLSSYMKQDKKNEFGRILFALLDGIGNVKIDQQVSKELIFNAFEDYQS